MSDSISESFLIICTVMAFLSLVANTIMTNSLKEKTSTYARLMRHIVISESIFIFALLIFVTHKHSYYKSFFDFIFNVFKVLTFGLTDNSYVLVVTNISTLYSMQTFSILLNFFISLEMILILKNPIAQMKSRMKFYFGFSGMMALVVFCIVYIPNSALDWEKAEVYQATIPENICLVVYSLFTLIGLISLLYLFCRFCLGKSLLTNLKNVFVIRHFIYVTLYITCFVLDKINTVLVLLGKERILYEESVYLVLSLGLIMFLIRSCETEFYLTLLCRKKPKVNLDKSNDSDSFKKYEGENFFDINQPLTAIISRNMNLEFMCCILFGLTEIFMKPERKKLSDQMDLSKIRKTEASQTHSITLMPQTSFDKSLLNKDIGNKDYYRVKSHKIRYKKIFDDNMDFDKIEVEVSYSPKKNRKSIDSSEFSSEIEKGNCNYDKDHDALVLEYCPKIFRELRRIDDITGIALQSSLSPALNQQTIIQVKESQGKSGSFFFFSHDNRFLIKTVTNNELKTMLGNFIKNYYDHVSSTPETLLAKIYGLYTIVIKGVSKINVILMQNLITIPKLHIKRIFDLKGSRVERITKNIEKCDKMKALKDLDYLWMVKIEQDLVDFTRDQIEEISNSLQKDLAMLREVKVMDYSLLLIIIYFPKQEDPDYLTILNLFGDPRFCHRIFKSKNQKYIYLLGIIDYLQMFNVGKFFENKYKSILYGNEIKYVSAVDPILYSERLFNFARDNIFLTSHT